MKILFYAIVGGLIGYLLGRLHRAIIDRLAERSEPKRDAPGKRDPRENPFEGFEPPIGICPSIHTYRRGHPENRFCCKCGAGEHHPIHDIPAHLKSDKVAAALRSCALTIQENRLDSVKAVDYLLKYAESIESHESSRADPLKNPAHERPQAERDAAGEHSEILQISGPTDDQERAVFIHFKLTNGGRVHIPVDQIQRMWNAEQRQKAGKTDPGRSQTICGQCQQDITGTDHRGKCLAHQEPDNLPSGFKPYCRWCRLKKTSWLQEPICPARPKSRVTEIRYPAIAPDGSGRWGLWYGEGPPARSFDTEAEAEEHLRNVLES